MKVRLPAFAKLNPRLEVLGRRADGYHEIRTILQTIDLNDEIELETREGVGIELVTEGREVPSGSGNLVFRAAELFQEETGFRTGLRLRLLKQLPVGAGIGGGSSDAAATLVALNSCAGDILSRGELANLGARLGSDVPFFLWGGTAFGQGRGERIQPLEDVSSEEAIILVWPGFQVSAATAYGALEAAVWSPGRDLTSRGPDTTIREFFGARSSGRWGALRNDLETPVSRLHPELNKLKRFLKESGCRETLLAGSGSSVFGIGDPSTLHQTVERCREVGWRDTFLCRPLSRDEYCRRWAASGVRLKS